MKSVLLLRHGKSDWGAEYETDHDRPLAPRGAKAAKRMGRYLAGLGQIPNRAVTSSALRARETVRLAAKAGSWPCPIDVDSRLYAASPADVLTVLRECDDSAESVLLAGHAPTWSETLGELTGGVNVKFPTAGMARVEIAVERWSEVAFGLGVLVWFVPPRVLSRIGWP
jgi:phosphohistidine phosphatase